MSEYKKIDILTEFSYESFAIIKIKNLQIEEIISFNNCKFYPGNQVSLDNLFSNYIDLSRDTVFEFTEEDTLFVCNIKYEPEFPFAKNIPLEDKLIQKVKNECYKYLSIILYVSCNFEYQANLPYLPGYYNNEQDAIVFYNRKYGIPSIYTTQKIAHFITRNKCLRTNITDINLSCYKKIFQLPDNSIAKEILHAFHLYMNILYSSNETDKFILSMQMIEFLGNPYEYMKMEEVKKNIIPFIAKSNEEYNYIIERFKYLTSKKDNNNQQIGYRTNIIHQGKFIEDLIPETLSQIKLNRELQYYIVSVLEEYIKLYDKTWDYIQEEKRKKIDIIQKNKQQYIDYTESSLLFLVDIDFLNQVINNLMHMYEAHSIKKIDLCKFLICLLKQIDIKTPKSKINFLVNTNQDETPINNSDITNIFDLEQKGFECEYGIIDLNIGCSKLEKKVLYENFLNNLSINSNFVLSKIYPHKNIVLITDLFEIDDKLINRLENNGINLILGRLNNYYSLIKSDNLKWFDIELLLLPLMGIALEEMPDNNSTFNIIEDEN